MPRSIAGPRVDASYLARIVANGQKKHGEKFDASDLESASIFAPYYRTDTRLKVRRGNHTRTGRVGITTGWRPAFLLVHRSSDHGSWDLLGPADEIIAIWNGRQYQDV